MIQSNASMLRSVVLWIAIFLMSVLGAEVAGEDVAKASYEKALKKDLPKAEVPFELHNSPLSY